MKPESPGATAWKTAAKLIEMEKRMMRAPLTATMIVEANREYWSRPDVIGRWTRIDDALTVLTERMVRRIMDIIRERTKDGWPTREDGGDIC